MIVDCHSHLLPGIDDGALDSAMSEKMLLSLKKSKIDTIVLTPHFYPLHQKVEEFIENRNRAYKELCGIEASGKFAFALGAEVYLPNLMFDYDKLNLLTINGTRYILTELPYVKSLNAILLQNLKSIILNHNLVPIIAHIDRYPFFRDDENIKTVLEMGCLLQLNLESLKKYFSRGKYIKFLEKGYISMLGNDLHRDDFDNWAFNNTIDLIERKAGIQTLENIRKISLRTLFNP